MAVHVLYAMAETTQPPAARGQYRKKKIPECVRNAVWNKYMGEAKRSPCYTGCGEIISAALMHVGHIQAESCGGETTIQNLRPICSKCNTSMGRKNMREFIAEWGFTSPLTLEDDTQLPKTEIPSKATTKTTKRKKVDGESKAESESISDGKSKAESESKAEGESISDGESKLKAKTVTKRKQKISSQPDTTPLQPDTTTLQPVTTTLQSDTTTLKPEPKNEVKVATKRKPKIKPVTQPNSSQPESAQPEPSQVKSEDILIQPVDTVTHGLLFHWSPDEMMFAAEQLSGVKGLDAASARTIVSGVSRNIWCREFLKKFTVAQLRATAEFTEYTRGRTKKHDIVAAIAEGVSNIHTVKIASVSACATTISPPIDSVRTTWCCFM